jgi:hypothetical protein
VKQHISAVVAIASNPDLSKQVTSEMKSEISYAQDFPQLMAKERHSRVEKGEQLSSLPITTLINSNQFCMGTRCTDCASNLL